MINQNRATTRGDLLLQLSHQQLPAEVHSEPNQIAQIELFVKIVNRF